MIRHKIQSDLPESLDERVKFARDVVDPEIVRCGCVLMLRKIAIKAASPEIDMRHGVDVITPSCFGQMKWACRARFDCNYRDITIRSKSRYGFMTELDKIRGGQFEADCYGYAWYENARLDQLIVIDMRIAIAHGVFNGFRKEIPNGDGTAFIAVDLEEFHAIENCVMCEWMSGGLFN